MRINRWFQYFTTIIDKSNLWIGQTGLIMVIAIICVLFYEAISRYVFHNPTSWALEIATIMQVVLVALTLGYVLKEEGHISITLLVERIPPRYSNWLISSTSIISALACGFMAYMMVTNAKLGLLLSQCTLEIGLPLFPFKVLLTFGLCLFGLQFIARSYKYYKQTRIR